VRFEIDASCKRGLRIIRELPDFEVSRIEGYNGIGKSSALRLLELCTGSQPYHGQDNLWASFREQLVHATVRVTGLQGGAGEITWDLRVMKNSS
jgi:RNase adaptor protein for sRNA GlmZ degradation